MDFDWTRDLPTPAPNEAAPPKKKFDPLPEGEYAVIISDQKTKPNRAGTGEYLELTLVIEDGSFRGRRIWDRHNLRNPNQKTVQIARETVERIKDVTGIDARNAAALVGGRMRVTTINDDFGAKVKSYLPPTTPNHQQPVGDDGLPF